MVAGFPATANTFITGRGIIGHEAARRVLWGALERNEVAGSYLLKGPTGVGKATLARAYAQAAACPQPARDPFGACEQCLSCKMAMRGDHPEIVSIAPAGDQTQIWQFWDRPGRPPGVLENALQYSPSVGIRRVFIIERADTLNDAAANSLLKVIEEPPSFAVFLLLTPNAERLPLTIVSRCQAISMTPMPVADLASQLIARFELPPDRARLIAGVAEGRTGDACRMAADPTVFDHITEAFHLALQLGSAPPLRALRLSEDVRGLAARLAPGQQEADTPAEDDDRPQSRRGRTDRGQVAAVIELLIFAYREIAAVTLGIDGSGLLSAASCDARASIERFGPKRCLAALDVLISARRRLDQNVSPALLTDWIATSIATTAP